MKFKMFFASLFLSLSLSAHAQGFMAVANVTKISGSATVKTPKYEEKLKVGGEVTEGMTISIPKAKDFIEVKFQNGHLVRFVGANVKIKELNPKNYLFELIKGKFFSAIKPLTQNETFVVKTRRASFAVRGTRFYIEEGKKSTYLCVCEGVVNVKTDKGEIDIKKDEDLTLAPKRDLKATLAAKSMIDMSNAVFKEMGI